MPLKERDLRKVTFHVPSEQLVDLINAYFAKRYLEKPSADAVLGKVESLLEDEGFDLEWLELLYDKWVQEQPAK